MARYISVKKTTGPALLSGGLFYEDFGEYEAITSFMMTTDLSAKLNSSVAVLSGYDVSAYGEIVSNNQVLVHVEKTSTVISGAATVPAAVVAASGDVIDNTFTFLAQGE